VEYDISFIRFENAHEQTVDLLFEKEDPSPSNGRATKTMSAGHESVTQTSLGQIRCYASNNMDQGD
jgi:hypothetical protein